MRITIDTAADPAPVVLATLHFLAKLYQQAEPAPSKLDPADNPATGAPAATLPSGPSGPDYHDGPTSDGFAASTPYNNNAALSAAEVFAQPAALVPGVGMLPAGDAAAVFAANGGAAAPLPPPAATAPPAVTGAPDASAPKPSDAPGTGLDSRGLPWDGRIHASSKVRNADGSWRAKRGLNDGALVARVEAELRAAVAAPAAPAMVPVQPVPMPTSTPPVMMAPPMVTPPPAAVLPPPAVPMEPFPDLCLAITAGKQAGWLTDAHRDAALQSVQVPNLPALASRPDLVPTVRAFIEQYRPQGGAA